MHSCALFQNAVEDTRLFVYERMQECRSFGMHFGLTRPATLPLLSLRKSGVVAVVVGDRHASSHLEQSGAIGSESEKSMAFGKKKEGLYLRPRVRRTTPLMDIAFAIVIGGASGIYIFNDTMRRWQQSELMERGEFDVAATPASTDTKESSQ